MFTCELARKKCRPAQKAQKKKIENNGDDRRNAKNYSQKQVIRGRRQILTENRNGKIHTLLPGNIAQNFGKSPV